MHLNVNLTKQSEPLISYKDFNQPKREGFTNITEDTNVKTTKISMGIALAIYDCTPFSLCLVRNIYFWSPMHSFTLGLLVLVSKKN